MNSYPSQLFMIITRALALGTIVYGVITALPDKEIMSRTMITAVIIVLYLSLDALSGIFSKTDSVFCGTVCGIEDPPVLAVKTILDNDSISTDVQEAVRVVTEQSAEEATADEHVPVPAETEEGFISYSSW